MKDKIEKILDGFNIPYKYLLRPSIGIKKTVLSYHFFNESNVLKGDGKGRIYGGNVQLDIFSKENNRQLIRDITREFEKQRILLVRVEEDQESFKNQILYHKIIIFEYFEESEA